MVCWWLADCPKIHQQNLTLSLSKEKIKHTFHQGSFKSVFVLNTPNQVPNFRVKVVHSNHHYRQNLKPEKKTRSGDQLPSLKPTASSPLKINGWKMQIPFGASLPMFSGQTCCYFQGGYLEAPYPPIPSPLSSAPPPRKHQSKCLMGI